LRDGTAVVVRLHSLLLALSLLLGASCSNTNEPGTPQEPGSTMVGITGVCGEKPSYTCPTKTPPSYTKEIAPLLDEKCNGCHIGGAGHPWQLRNYDDLVHWRSRLFPVLVDCSMPPSDAAETLTSEERALVETWVICGMPKN
jgi:hypothetical protein